MIVFRYNGSKMPFFAGGGGVRPGEKRRKTPLFALPFIYIKMHRFTKTGSGQT
jgi:hypothetical protein